MATETNTGTTTTTDPAAAVEPGVARASAEAASGELAARAGGSAKRPAAKRAPAKKSATTRPAARKSVASATVPKATEGAGAAAGDTGTAPATAKQSAELPASGNTLIEMPLEVAQDATDSSGKAGGTRASRSAKPESPAALQTSPDAAAAAPVQQPTAGKSAVEETAEEKPASRRPAARKPAAKKPASKRPAAKKASVEAATGTTTASRKPAAQEEAPAKKEVAARAGTRQPEGKQQAADKSSASGGNPRSGQSPKPRVVPPAPRLPRSGKTVVDGRGEPIVGARHGSPEIVDWSALAEHHRPNRLTRIRKHRRWVYATASTDQYLVALAVADVGPMGTAFVMVTDLTTGEVIADSSRPGAVKPLVHVSYEPREGLTARYRLPGTEYEIHREKGSKETHIRVSLRRPHDSLPGLRSVPVISRMPLLRDLPTASHRPWLDVDLTLEEGAAPHLTAVSPVDADGGLVTSTVKTAAMPAWGTVTVHDGDTTRVVTMDGGTGGIDYTNGFLPRHTSWRWAYSTGRLSDGRLFGINLVSGFSGIGDDAWENALWLDGALIPLQSEARIMCDEDDLMAPWTIRTVDGSVHLIFRPRAIHTENVNIGVFRGSLQQPAGTISGHVLVDGQRVVVSDLAAVVEDQDYLW